MKRLWLVALPVAAVLWLVPALGNHGLVWPDEIYQSLEQHPEQQTTLQHWSEQFGVTEKTLSRLFLRDTGLTFRAWRQRLRLLGALTPLEQGERVTDVALACGYDSTSAFIAAFRQQFGETPGEFFR